jgi:exosortase/archaeosortase family protein
MDEQDAEVRKNRIKKISLQLIKTFLLWLLLVGLFTNPHLIDFFKSGFIPFTRSSIIILSKIFRFPAELNVYPDISIFHFRMKVIYECTAFNYYLFILSLMIFSGWSLKLKIINGLIMIFTVFILNSFRFILLGYIGRNYYNLFDSIHNYFWNVLFAVLILILWFILNERAWKIMKNETTL